MLYFLENEYLKVSVATEACEINSIYDKKTETERIWQPKAGYWKQRGPILFPQISSNSSNKVRIKGKEYEMGNHGFTRYAEFEFLSQSDKQLKFSFSDNENTLKQYPYHFKMIVTYTLVENKLNVNYDIVNLNEEVMPFGFGLHPAFKTDVFETDNYESYQVSFSANENDTVANEGLDMSEPIKLSRELFKKYPTIIVENPKSDFAILTNGKHGVKVEITGYYLFALWTPDDADFICLEPWRSAIANSDIDDLETRKNVIKLNSNETYTTAYSIEVF